MNFDRPDFRRMMEDINTKTIDCIIVKDLSRFGRDYIETGRLIQKIFPIFGVRFIAVTDHFDSLSADYNETSLVLPVRNFINDSYCQDISNKVKSHQKIKRENGEFIGAFTVYGYCKDKNNKNKLIPDPYAAQIVQLIFSWKMEGMSTRIIAEKLNEMGILSPMEYKKSKGENYTTSFASHRMTPWSSVAVKRILVNELYTGTMVQGKSEKINYKLRQSRQKPKEEWIRIENTHVPIITKEEFNKVQQLLDTGSRAFRGQKKAHLFSGLLFCGDCKKPMIRRINRYKDSVKVYFICPTRNKGKGCTRHSISEEELKKIILQGLQSQINLWLDEQKVCSNIKKKKVDFRGLQQFNQEIARLDREREKYLSLQNNLYEDVKEKIITPADFHFFQSIFQEQTIKIQGAVEKQKKTLQMLFQSGADRKLLLEQFKEKIQLTELNRDILLTFIEKILVYKDHRICMKLRNKEPFCKIL